ncbi:MAG TPA: TrkH family potassium uptake protein [Bacteroidales bacterium]|jgi:trk system potassium uptake protein TrkH|nr:TrkH family potassium uptake protein [Bacteroidales bacterium]
MRLIHPLIILKVLSNILFIETLTFLACLPVAIIYKESSGPFLISSLITLIGAGVLFLLTRKANTNEISSRDSFITVTSAWILFSLCGALPYILSGTIPSFLDAFFESSSGFTTTGASILQNVEILPFSIHFWRSLTHWIGGIGIIVLVILILPSLKVTGYQLFSLESSLKEKIHPKTKGVAIRIMVIYIVLTLLETLLLVLGDMNLFDSICHSFGTIATGGFSTKNTSLMDFSSYSQYVVMIFMFLAGISQVIYYYLVKMNFKKIKHNEELWFYLAVVIVAGTLAFSILMVNGSKQPEEAFREGFFQTISIITCTGFANTDFILWPVSGTMLLFMLMFSGGSTGSTSGGIKMARHLIVLKNLKSVFVRLLHPGTISPVRLNGKVLDERTNVSIISFIILYVFLFLTGTIILTVSGSDIMTSASSVATCLAGIGPGFGNVGPMGNYSGIPEVSKVVLSLVMIIGRLEIVTVFLMFGKSFWRL